MEQLTKKTSTNIDHKKSLLDTATELNNLKYHDASEAGAKVNHDDINQSPKSGTLWISVITHELYRWMLIDDTNQMTQHKPFLDHVPSNVHRPKHGQH